MAQENPDISVKELIEKIKSGSAFALPFLMSIAFVYK